MQGLAQWLSATSLSQAIQRTLWLIPALQAIHILGNAVVLTSAVMVARRILGFPRSQTMTATAHRFVPWLWAGLVVLAATGLLLVIGEPKRALLNPAFQLKMLFLATVLAVTLAVQVSLARNIAFWEASPHRRTRKGVLVVCGLLLWCAVAIAGRWIAYTQAS